MAISFAFVSSPPSVPAFSGGTIAVVVAARHRLFAVGLWCYGLPARLGTAEIDSTMPARLNSGRFKMIRLIYLFDISLSAALLYGINLYFSTNANINNPVVPVWWPVTKDAILFLIFCVLLFGLRRHLPRLSIPLALVAVFSMTCAALSVSIFGFSSEAISFSKNILLYFTGGAAIGAVIAHAYSPTETAVRISRAVLLSVLISFICLLLPVQSLDDRLYGTYGNPTSFGFAVFLAFALSVAIRPPLESTLLAVLLGLVFVVTGSMSVLIAAVAFLVLFSALEIFNRRSIRLQVVHLIAIALSIAFFGTVLRHFHGPAFGHERLAEIATAITQSDSTTVRLKAFARPFENTYQRYDGFLLGLYKNFGWAPLLVYLGLIASLVAMYRRSLQTKAQNAIAASIVCIFILNPMLQHQIEIFPTNFLFGTFLGCAIFWLGRNVQQEDAPIVPILQRS
ncbi:MAG TPA: hypothetical protein VIR82_23050 [Bradyrhizobium sp.]